MPAFDPKQTLAGTRVTVAVAVGADLIGQALAGLGRVRLDVPLEGALLERQILAAGFRLSSRGPDRRRTN